MRLIFTDPAKKDYKGLAKEMRDRVQSALNRMLLHPEACDLIRIKGEPDKWRLRVGDWRVIMRMDQDAETIYVLRIRHRSEAYR